MGLARRAPRDGDDAGPTHKRAPWGGTRPFPCRCHHMTLRSPVSPYDVPGCKPRQHVRLNDERDTTIANHNDTESWLRAQPMLHGGPTGNRIAHSMDAQSLRFACNLAMLGPHRWTWPDVPARWRQHRAYPQEVTPGRNVSFPLPVSPYDFPAPVSPNNSPGGCRLLGPGIWT